MHLDAFRHHALALMLVDPRFLTAASIMVQPRYFTTPEEQHICRTVLELHREFRKVPKRIAVVDSLSRYFKTTPNSKKLAQSTLALLDDVGDLASDASEVADYLHTRMVEFCRDEAFKDALLKGAEDLKKGSVTPATKARFEKALSTGADLHGPGIFWLQDSEDAESGVSSLDEIRHPVATGLPFVDNPLKGGGGRGELVIAMAPPNTGKTTFLTNVGVGALKNRAKVVHFSCEMQARLIRSMYDRCFLNATNERLASLDPEERKQVVAYLKRLRSKVQADVNIKHFAPHKLSVDGIRSHLLMLEYVYNFVPDLVIVDYIDLLAMPTHIKDEIRQLTWVGEEFRAICSEFNVSGWTATQVNRGGVGKETAMESDVAGDFQKLAYADHVCSLNQTKDEVESGLMRVFWMKTRAGAKYKTFTTQTDFSVARIEPA